MLKAEFRKIFKQGLIYFILAGVIIFALFGAINYTSNSTLDTYKHHGYQITPYKTPEDVRLLLNDCQNKLDSGENLGEETISALKTSIKIYEYLINDKYIEYDDLIDYQGLNTEFYANKFSFFRYFIGIMRIALPILLGIMASLIVTSDFQNGMEKAIYTRSCSRLNVVRIKYVSWSCISAALILAIILFGSLYGLSFNGHRETQSILLANTSTAFLANYFEVIMLEFADVVVRVFAYGSIAFFLSLYCKNILVALIPNAAMYLTVYLCYFIKNTIVNNIVQGVMSVFDYNGSSTINIVYVLIIYLICIGFSMLSMLFFRKKDIK